MGLFEELTARGLIAQMTHPDEIRRILNEKTVTFYIGFDPTAQSLHVGHFLQLVVMRHMQMAGHRPIALLGGGTVMVGDPTGKTEMRRVMSADEIQDNTANFKQQFSRYIDFNHDKALMVNNADWLLNLNYINFLRDVGTHFSVNRMLTAECFKARLAVGLSFIEFNYMLMQSYDFYVLNQKYDCILQLGGDDQWSNIIGGMELIRRKANKRAYGMTFQLLTTSDGKKMGKTEKGAVWIDADKTTPYEFYQYWRNIEDGSVIKCLKMLTFLPLEEIARYEDLQGSELNEAKKVLAYEVTKLVHGGEHAAKARDAAVAIFESGVSSEDMPTYEVCAQDLADGVNVLDLLLRAGVIPSKAEGKRLIAQNSIALNEQKLTDIGKVIRCCDFDGGEMIVRRGKKTHHKIKLV